MILVPFMVLFLLTDLGGEANRYIPCYFCRSQYYGLV